MTNIGNQTRCYNLLIIFIKFYRFFISPLIGINCRFYPSCSEYAMQAIVIHGNIKGLWLFLKRIIKCQPFCHGGYDPVADIEIKQNVTKS